MSGAASAARRTGSVPTNVTDDAPEAARRVGVAGQRRDELVAGVRAEIAVGRDPVAQAEERRLVEQRFHQVAGHRGDEEMGAVRADVDRCRDDGRGQRDDLGSGFGPRLELDHCFGDRFDDRRGLGDHEQGSGIVVRNDLDGLDDEGRGGDVLERLRVGLDGRFGLSLDLGRCFDGGVRGRREIRLGPRGGRFGLRLARWRGPVTGGSR